MGWNLLKNGDLIRMAEDECFDAFVRPLRERIRTARLYWLEADVDAAAAGRLAREIFCDVIVEKASVNEPLYDDVDAKLIEVARKPGVMDPVAASIRKIIADRK